LAWAVDFGVPAFSEAAAPSWALPGLFVSGEVYLGMDRFDYKEGLKNKPGMPDLFRNWFVRRIFLETTPRNEARDGVGTIMMTRDIARESFREIPRTDAWNVDPDHILLFSVLH
jgi:hypothetical protein